MWRWLAGKSTGDLLVILVAATICLGLVVSGAALIAYEFIHPGADVGAASRLLAGTVNTLIGLLAGFLAGRTEAKTNGSPPKEPPDEAP